MSTQASAFCTEFCSLQDTHSTVSLTKQSRTAAKAYRIFLFQFIACSGFSNTGLLSGPKPQNEIALNKIRISRRPCLPSTPNPPTTKMVVKPRTNGQSKMWWCSVLHEVQFIINAPLTDMRNIKFIKCLLNLRSSRLRKIISVRMQGDLLCNNVSVYAIHERGQESYYKNGNVHKRNTQPRSCNNCCSGKAISTTYSGRVFVALVIYHAHVPYCHLRRVWLYHIFIHYHLNGTICEKRLLSIKCVFWFSLRLSPETFLILRRTVRDVIIPVYWSSCTGSPTSTHVFLGFPVSTSKCWDGSQDSKLPLHASHVALLT